MSNYPPNPQAYPPQFLPPGPHYPQPMPPPIARRPREYSIFGAMLRAPFFNGNVSRDVARNWRGIGFWYLFLLLLLTWIIVLVKVHFGLAVFVRDEFPDVVKDVPPVTIRNGHVTSPVEQPYYIKDSKSGKAFAVLDTTGIINSMDDTEALLLVTDHKVWMRQSSNNEIKQYDLSKVNYFYVDKTKVIGWMALFGQFFALAVLPLALVGSLCWRLVQALLYGAINLGFSSGFRADLDYAAAMRLAVVSITPVVLLDTIPWVGGWTIPAWWLIGIGISIVYMAMAVKANGNANPPMGFSPIPYPPVGYPPPAAASFPYPPPSTPGPWPTSKP